MLKLCVKYVYSLCTLRGKTCYTSSTETVHQVSFMARYCEQMIVLLASPQATFTALSTTKHRMLNPLNIYFYTQSTTPNTTETNLKNL